jgi:hypothetical protein
MENKIYEIKGRMAFVKVSHYLNEISKPKFKGEKEVEPSVKVPINEYSLNGLKIKLIGNELIDIRTCEIRGKSINNIKKTAKKLQEIVGSEILFKK